MRDSGLNYASEQPNPFSGRNWASSTVWEQWEPSHWDRTDERGPTWMDRTSPPNTCSIGLRWIRRKLVVEYTRPQPSPTPSQGDLLYVDNMTTPPGEFPSITQPTYSTCPKQACLGRKTALSESLNGTVPSQGPPWYQSWIQWTRLVFPKSPLPGRRMKLN